VLRDRRPVEPVRHAAEGAGAADALHGNVHGTFGDTVAKVVKIMANADPASVLPAARSLPNLPARQPEKENV